MFYDSPLLHGHSRVVSLLDIFKLVAIDADLTLYHTIPTFNDPWKEPF